MIKVYKKLKIKQNYDKTCWQQKNGHIVYEHKSKQLTLQLQKYNILKQTDCQVNNVSTY